MDAVQQFDWPTQASEEYSLKPMPEIVAREKKEFWKMYWNRAPYLTMMSPFLFIMVNLIQAIPPTWREENAESVWPQGGAAFAWEMFWFALATFIATSIGCVVWVIGRNLRVAWLALKHHTTFELTYEATRFYGFSSKELELPEHELEQKVAHDRHTLLGNLETTYM